MSNQDKHRVTFEIQANGQTAKQTVLVEDTLSDGFIERRIAEPLLYNDTPLYALCRALSEIGWEKPGPALAPDGQTEYTIRINHDDGPQGSLEVLKDGDSIRRDPTPTQ